MKIALNYRETVIKSEDFKIPSNRKCIITLKWESKWKTLKIEIDLTLRGINEFLGINKISFGV